MAKKRGAPKGPAQEPMKAIGRKSITTLKGSPEWAAWLERLAGHDRNTVAGLIDRALVEYAKNHGFLDDAPKR